MAGSAARLAVTRSHTPTRARLPGAWQGNKPTSNSAADLRTPRCPLAGGWVSKLCRQLASSTCKPVGGGGPPGDGGRGPQSLGRQPEVGMYLPAERRCRALSCIRRTLAAFTAKVRRSFLP